MLSENPLLKEVVFYGEIDFMWISMHPFLFCQIVFIVRINVNSLPGIRPQKDQCEVCWDKSSPGKMCFPLAPPAECLSLTV